MSKEVILQVDNFFKYRIQDIELYNEAGLQHELAIFLREVLDNAKVRLEYSVYELPSIFPNKNKKFIKKEIDIFIEYNKEKVVVELKFPRKDAGFPIQIYKAIEDIAFCEEVLSSRKATNFLAIFLTDHSSVMAKKEGRTKNKKHIYSLFNADNPKLKELKIDSSYPNFILKNASFKSINLKNEYDLNWVDLNHKNGSFRYYIISK